LSWPWAASRPLASSPFPSPHAILWASVQFKAPEEWVNDMSGASGMRRGGDEACRNAPTQTSCFPAIARCDEEKHCKL